MADFDLVLVPRVRSQIPLWNIVNRRSITVKSCYVGSMGDVAFAMYLQRQYLATPLEALIGDHRYLAMAG
jgi:hypothetical protein